MWTDRRALVGFAGASLLLNVFLAGEILGRAIGWRSRSEAPAIAAGPLVPPAQIRALPVADRRRFQDAMAPHRPAIRAAREAHRAARRQIEADIAAPDFDRAKITADFEVLAQSNRNTENALDPALVDALSQLPRESRAALVKRERFVPAPRSLSEGQSQNDKPALP